MSGSKARSTPHPRLSGLQPDVLLAQGLPTTAPDVIAIPGFELETQIGRGGMGAVFLARQITLDRKVAVKVLVGELAGDPLLIERIGREARTMASLRHPHIVTVHDFLTLEDGSAAVVMEYVEGGNLREKLRSHPQGLPVEEALRLLGQIAMGLETAHASGVIHRDMKPENVLLDHGVTARVTDFGLALPLRESSLRLTLTGMAVGTVDYMAPEQLKGGELDGRADIFALGVMAYELLTGQTPRGSFDPPHQLRAEVPAYVSQAVMKAMRPSPSERFADMEAFMLALHPSNARQPSLPWAKIMGITVGIFIVAALVWTAPMLLKREEVTSSVPLPEPAPPAPPTPISIPTPQAPPQFEPGAWRDAIAGVRIHDGNFGGDWTLEDGLLTSNDGICVMALEEKMPEYYDARMKFTRLRGRHSVTLFFRANHTVGSAELDAWDKGLAGVQLINAETLEEGYGFRFPLENGRSYELLVEVRPNLVRMTVDGVFQKEFDITGKFLHPPAPWGWDSVSKPAALAVGSYEGSTQFEMVEWREVKLAGPAASSTR